MKDTPPSETSKAKIIEEVIEEQRYNQTHQEANITELKNVLKNQKIVLFLGAGVSCDYGIPGWDALLKKLFSDEEVFNIQTEALWEIMKESIIKDKLNDSLQQGRIIELKCGSEAKFKELVRKHLYSNYQPNNDETNLNTLDLLIDNFFLSKKVESVVTFNFDDLLEKKLTNQQIDCRTIHNESNFSSLKAGEMPVFHPHGFLPFNPLIGVESEKYSIVFSETAYHKTYSDTHSWSNLIQLSKLTNYTCIFMGISLSDPNMRRLLDSAKKISPKHHHHYILTTKTKKGSDDLNVMIDGIFSEYAESLNVKTIYYEGYKQLLKDFLINLNTF